MAERGRKLLPEAGGRRTLPDQLRRSLTSPTFTLRGRTDLSRACRGQPPTVTRTATLTPRRTCCDDPLNPASTCRSAAGRRGHRPAGCRPSRAESRGATRRRGGPVRSVAWKQCMAGLVPEVRRRGNRHDGADRLDPVGVAMVIDELHHHRGRRSSSACAKFADALRKISFMRFSSRTSRFNAFARWRSAVVRPPRSPLSRSACRTHFRSVSAVHPACPQSTRSRPTRTGAQPRARGPAAPLALVLRVNT